MQDYEADEALDAALESDGEFSEADQEDDEAARGWQRRRPKVADGRGLFRQRPQAGYVSQAQLQSALAKVGGQLRANATAIKDVGGRVSAAAATLKKETADRKKDITTVKSNMNQAQQLAILLPMLMAPKQIKVPDNIMGGITGQTTEIPAGTDLLIGTDNPLTSLLPFMFLSGTGDGSSAGPFGGSDNSMIMMLALIMAMGK